MQDMAANPSRKSTRCKTCCRCHACRCPFNVVHILHHACFYLVNSIEGAPTRMLHSVYIFSTRVGSHILHHACFSAQPQQKKTRRIHTCFAFLRMCLCSCACRISLHSAYVVHLGVGSQVKLGEVEANKGQVGTRLGPSWSQDAPSWRQECPSWAKLRPS